MLASMPSAIKGALRSVNWLIRHRYGPNIYGFRNLESGQVLFSQLPFLQEYYRDALFKYHSLKNRTPKLRSDLWRAMVVVELPTHEKAVDFYKDLTELREMRDYSQLTQANIWRKKDETTGRVWSWGQFRPTYTQEAVADLISASEASAVDLTMYWEDAWRKGNSSNWSDVKVKHDIMPLTSSSQKFVFMRRLTDESFKKAMAIREDGTAKEINKQGWIEEKEEVSEPQKVTVQSEKIPEKMVGVDEETKREQKIQMRERKVAEARILKEKAEKELEAAHEATSAGVKRTARRNLQMSQKVLKRAERLLKSALEDQ